MGRKEKIVNVTVTPSSSPPLQTSIISKRTYTRQLSNKSTNPSAESSSTQHQLNDTISDVTGEIVSKQSNEPFVNDAENSVQCNDVANGRIIVPNAKTKRRSTIGKNVADASDSAPIPPQSLAPTNNTVSSICQRPRRQVKHKFIKSANINVIEKTNDNSNNVQSNDVNEPPSNSLTLLNSLSPNSKVRLVPLVHRLPMNATKLNWQDVVHPMQTDMMESIDDPNDTLEILSDGAFLNVDNEPATTVIKEMKTERHKKLSNSKQAIRRGRQLRQTVCPVEPVESNNAHTDASTEETEDDSVHETTVIDGDLTSAFDDDEDDIMIVEEKDALDVPDQIEFDMTEEVIIEETVADDDDDDVVDYTEVICVSPNHFNPNLIAERSETSFKKVDTNDSNTSIEAHDNSKPNQQPLPDSNNLAGDNQTEPIYLSDSLSCFDSDSDTQESEMQTAARKSPSHVNAEQIMGDNMDDDIGPLNESTDDVILVPECAVEPIEVDDQSDSEDERFAKKFSFETFVDSDSQPTVDSSKAEDTSDSAYKRGYDSARLDETTTDADDDSSEVEKRATRSRRDNVGRKNYSIRRTYARRKLKNDTDSLNSNEPLNQSKPEDCSTNDLTEESTNAETDERLNSRIIENDIKTKLVQDNNTTDGTGTDEENQFNMMRTKAIRTYVRRKASISKLATCGNDTANASKENEKNESDSQSENTTSSSNDAEVKPNISVEVNPAPRKRGRPRKKPLLNNGTGINQIEPSGASPKEICTTSTDQPCTEEQTIETQIQTLDISDADSQSIELVMSSGDSQEMPSNIVQDETILNDASQADCVTNTSMAETTYETTLEASTIETSAQPLELVDENMMEVERIVEDNANVTEQYGANKDHIVTEVDSMEVDCIESKHIMDAQSSHHVEGMTTVKQELQSASEQIVEAPTITAPIAIEESSSAEPTEGAEMQEVNADALEIEPATSKVSKRLSSEEKVSESQGQMITEQSIVESLVVESMEEPKPAQPSTQDIKEEPAVESISVKIENITIDAESKVKSPSKSLPNVAEPHLNDTKSDVKQPKIKSEEQTPSKLDEVKAAKETNVPSALAGLPKEVIEEIEDTSIRRSGRIRTINRTKQRSQGFGLVKDKKRAPVIVDEDSSSAGFDGSTDTIQDKDASQSGGEVKVRVKTDVELEKEKVDRENGMKLFVPIIDNEYRSERTISKEAKKMTCDCFLTQSEIERGEMGCGDDCLNRMLLIECGPKCIVGDRCTNRRFQMHENSSCNIFKTEKKGYGLVATGHIPAGQFIMEYVGEVLNSKQFEKRANDYSKQMNAHYYFMALSSDCVIDATKKGNISRFINHSCDPNAETQKWTVNGELRIGFFSKKPIMQDDEITFDYQFQRYGKEAQKCYCESINCRGWIGGEPESEEELESDDDEEASKDDSELSESIVAISADGSGKKKGKTPKPKKPKDATKKPARKERAKANRKAATDFKKHKGAEIMEDPDLDKEIDVLATGGLKNQVQTLQLSRLFVRAKLQKAKLRLLSLLRDGELPCRRLFLDYHGLQLMHSWMSDVSADRMSMMINSADRMLSLTFRLEILQTLENLPITNKTTLQDSKVLSTVQRWSTVNEYSFLLNDSQSANNNHKITNPDESSPSDSGSGTPILMDEMASAKADEAPSSNTANQTPCNDTPSTEPTKESKSLDVSSINTSSVSVVKPSDVLDTIPQILEQNSTLKGMGLDFLKNIISTTAKNTKIIEDSEKLPDGEMGKLVRDICLLASKLVTTWEQLPESYKIPKKSRIEQMKQHEREANEGCKEDIEEKITTTMMTTSSKSQTFSSSGRFSERSGKTSDSTDSREKDPRDKDPRYRRSFNNSTLSKHQRRQMFEAKVAQEDAERKKMMENMFHESRCAFFHLDSRLTREFMVPFCVNPGTGQWYGDKMNKVPTPPSHAHIRPPPVTLPTDANEYIMPPIDLPDLWKYAINEKGQIYYYHTKILIPQWEPPIKLLPLMEEHRVNDIDLKVEAIETPLHTTDDDHEMEHDCDDEDEDVVSILSNSTMNANCLLELKSDPILEKYNDDDSSSTDSDDSLMNELAELEAKYSYIKKKTDDYWMNMKRPPNLNEEIAAMANPTSMPISMENTRMRDEEKPLNAVTKPNASDSRRKRKKNRAQLVQTIRISPLSEEMKRELRRDSRRYKENKAKLRRQKEMLLKRKSDMKSSHPDAPVRKLKKITEGLPQVSKHIGEPESHNPIDNHSFSVSSFTSSRYTTETLDSKRTKPSAFASLPVGGLLASSSSLLNSSLSALDPPIRTLQSTRNSLPSTSLTQSIVNKLPSIGHKFVGDTEELITKNTIKPIKPAEPVSAPVTVPVVNTIRSTPTQQSTPQQQQQLSPLVKKPPHTILNPAKSSLKPVPKKKKPSEPNECIDVNSPAARKIKEKFRSDISGDIVKHLKPYFSKTCTVGQIQTSDDFRHLARKLTFFVMLKELKHCNNVSLLEVTDSVKNKAREYIKKYMSKFGKTYIRDENEKDIHFEDL